MAVHGMTSETHQILQAAIGYLELGMDEDALRELERLSPAAADSLEGLEMRCVLLQRLGRWKEAAAMYGRLSQLEPANIDRYIARGCCLFELGCIEECRDALLEAPPTAREHALWNFHLACYEAHLGRTDEARRLAFRSLQLDPRLAVMARRNSRLGPLLAAT